MKKRCNESQSRRADLGFCVDQGQDASVIFQSSFATPVGMYAVIFAMYCGVCHRVFSV